MLVLISPAKIQNFEKLCFNAKYTLPEFMDEAESLVELMRQLSPKEVSRMLDINSKLTQLNFDRFFKWHTPFSPENSKQAVFTFNGEVFRGLNAHTLTANELDYAQSHLRIFSGLYGVLLPLDIIQPYRLDVSSCLRTEKGKDLYPFWREKVTDSINRALQKSGEPQVLLNLASSEYIKTLDLRKSGMRKIDVEFYEYQHDKFKQIVIYTKRARGLMARYVIENRIENEEDLKGFGADGYWYTPQLSTENKLVFSR